MVVIQNSVWQQVEGCLPSRECDRFMCEVG